MSANVYGQDAFDYGVGDEGRFELVALGCGGALLGEDYVHVLFSPVGKGGPDIGEVCGICNMAESEEVRQYVVEFVFHGPFPRL